MTPIVFNHTVPPDSPRGRADKTPGHGLSAAYSRVAIQCAFDAGLVRRNGAVADRSASVVGGDTLLFSLPETVPSELLPNAIALEIISEDRHLLAAVNKPAGMVVHPGAGTGGDTLGCMRSWPIAAAA